MKVLGRDKLTKFWGKHAASKSALEAWFDETSRAAWKTPQDIKNRFSSVDFIKNNRAIFNIKGNHYRLVVEVAYQNGVVVIEWVGTHAEYDKRSF